MTDIIIKIENGFVVDVYCTESANVIIVDGDAVKEGETFEECVIKSVMMMIEHRIRPEEIGSTVQSLLLEQNKLTDRTLQERTVPSVETSTKV
jgi:hypothetical protein